MSAVKSVAILIAGGKQFESAVRAVEAAAAETGASVSKPEIEFSKDQRLGAACAAIEKADLVVAEISARNPNTMYLAGYAHGIGKPVLFTALHAEDFPFDRERHPTVIYSGSADFLRTELLAFLRGGKPAVSSSGEESGSDARGQFNSIFGEIMKAHSQEHSGPIEMENDKTFIMRDQDLDLALVQDLARKAREIGYRIKLM